MMCRSAERSLQDAGPPAALRPVCKDTISSKKDVLQRQA